MTVEVFWAGIIVLHRWAYYCYSDAFMLIVKSLSHRLLLSAVVLLMIGCLAAMILVLRVYSQ